MPSAHPHPPWGNSVCVSMLLSKRTCHFEQADRASWPCSVLPTTAMGKRRNVGERRGWFSQSPSLLPLPRWCLLLLLSPSIISAWFAGGKASLPPQPWISNGKKAAVGAFPPFLCLGKGTEAMDPPAVKPRGRPHPQRQCLNVEAFRGLPPPPLLSQSGAAFSFPGGSRGLFSFACAPPESSAAANLWMPGSPGVFPLPLPL